MFNIHALATQTAGRARELKLRPNQVVLTICREAGIESSSLDSIKKLILSECGRRGGKAPRTKKNIQKLDFFSTISRSEHIKDATRCEASLVAGIPEYDL